MAEKAEYVSYASRPKVLLKYFGQLCFVLAALTIAPLFVSIVTAQGIVTLRYGGRRPYAYCAVSETSENTSTGPNKRRHDAGGPFLLFRPADYDLSDDGLRAGFPGCFF